MSVPRKVKYLLICEHASRDTNNKVNLNGIYDLAGASTLPVVPSRLVIAFSVGVTSTDIRNNTVNLTLQILDPKGKELLSVKGNGEIEKEGFLESSVDLSGRVVFSKKGTYAIKLFINNRYIKETNLEIVTGKQEDYRP